ncbi:hypothetical protein ACWEVP_38145 [Amycolatopsis sp. NPDC003865]
MQALIWFVTLAGVAAALAMLVIGVKQDLTYGKPVRDAARAVLESGKTSVEANADLIKQSSSDGSKTQTLEAQANALDTLGSTFEGIAKFATALKDLDAATRAYLISVAFLVIAATTASIGFIAG